MYVEVIDLFTYYWRNVIRTWLSPLGNRRMESKLMTRNKETKMPLKRAKDIQ